MENKQEMVNINANLVDEPTFSSFEKDGETVEVANFTLVKKYGDGKEYTNCSAYGDKVEIVECRPMSKTKAWNLLRVVERAAAE